MTFYLQDPARPRPPNPAPRDDAGLGEVFGAASEVAEISNNLGNRRRETRQAVLDEVAEKVGWTPPGNAVSNFVLRVGSAADVTQRIDQRAILAAAGKYAARDPGGYGGLPLTPDQVDAEVQRRMQEDYDEAQIVLQMGGRGSGVVAFVGSLARNMRDPDNLALALAGGGVGGGVVRTLAAEAGLGALGEAMALPEAYEQAEWLDIPDPNALGNIAMGAAAGAGLAAVPIAGARGYRYALGRKAAPVEEAPPGMDPAAAQAGVEATEAALLDGRPPPGPFPVEDDEIRSVARRIVGKESGGNPNARNPSSSAGGLGQFIDGTWLRTVKRYRPDIAAGRTDAQILALKTGGENAGLQMQMIEALTRENRDALAAEGLPTDAGSVYLAHFLGAGDEGAPRILRAPPDAPIANLLPPGVMQANRNVRFGGKFFQDFTAGDLRRWAEVKMGQAVDPGGGYLGGTRAGYTNPDQVVTPGGTRADVIYEVADAASLIPASGDIQPRDRTRAASAEQIGEMAARLDPARLMPSPEADRGAPIVGPDNIIESGNGRVQAIVMAAERFPDRYDAYVAAIADRFEIPEGVTRPVLIARRRSEMDAPARQAFVREANSSAIARMSATEQAGSDAAGIDDMTLSAYQPGKPLTAPENRAFTAAMMNRLPQAERAGLFTSDGRPNADGVRRLRSALFARAYDAPDMTRMLAELDGGDARGITEALADAAPAWAAMRAEIAAGRLNPELDATPQLMEAVRLIVRARGTSAASGGKVSVRGAIDDALAQDDLVTGPVAAETALFVELVYKGGRPRAAGDVSAFLNRYVDEARRVGSTEARLFADLDQPTAREILDAIRREDAAPGRAPGRPGARAGADQGGAGDRRSGSGDRSAGPAGGGDDAGQPVRSAGGEPGGGPDAAGDTLFATDTQARSVAPAAAPRPDIRAVDADDFAFGALSPEAVAADRSALRDLDLIIDEKGDFAVFTGNGDEAVSARELLDDIYADQEFNAVLDACVKGGPRDV